MKTTVKPLDGVKVIDFTIYVAAPAGTSVLGYLGADVIKVESPKGDPYRVTGAGFGLPIHEDENPLYDTVNIYKRDVCLNLRTDEGKAAMRRLIAEADIFVTNYREKALAAMGLTYEDVKAINPRIVYGKGGGYGDNGPDAASPGFDATAFFAKSGFLQEAAYPGAAPAVVPSGSGDTITSLSLTIGLLAAYMQAQATGEGCKVETSLYTSALWTLASPIVRRQYNPRATEGVDYCHPEFLAITCDYVCKDGVWVKFCGMQAETYWPAFCRALGLEEYANDPRFCTSPEQTANATACYALMAEKIREKTYAEWVPIFNENDLPYSKVLGVAESIKDPQAIANNYSCTLNYNGREVYFPMPPLQIDTLETPERTAAPKLGENTREVLKEYGYTDTELDELESRQAIKQK